MAKLAYYMRLATFKTVIDDVMFGAKDEWPQARVLQTQFQNIKSNSID